jgi:hypothetical protein
MTRSHAPRRSAAHLDAPAATRPQAPNCGSDWTRVSTLVTADAKKR